jgi:hypothetical protein
MSRHATTERCLDTDEEGVLGIEERVRFPGGSEESSSYYAEGKNNPGCRGIEAEDSDAPRTTLAKRMHPTWALNGTGKASESSDDSVADR